MSSIPGKDLTHLESSFVWRTRALLALCLLFFVCEGVVYNALILALLLPRSGNDAWVTPLAVVFNTLWALAFWCYVQVYRSSPGVVPMRWNEFVRTSGIVVVSTRRMWQPGMATLCRECSMARPERTHHCKRCGICVLRFDHHCPWINNCIGFQNHKYFLLVGVYSWALALVYCCSSLPELVRLLARMCRSDWDPTSEVIGWCTPLIFAGAWAFSLQALLLLSQMLFCYIPLAVSNLTRVEELIAHDSDFQTNPYDQGTITANLSQIFGTPGIDWLAPVPPLRPISDGISFPRQGDGSPPEDIAALGVSMLDLLSPRRLDSWRCWSKEGRLSSPSGRQGRMLIRGDDTEEDGPESLWLRRYRVRPPRKISTKRNGNAGAGLLGSFLMCRGEVQQQEDIEEVENNPP